MKLSSTLAFIFYIFIISCTSNEHNKSNQKITPENIINRDNSNLLISIAPKDAYQQRILSLPDTSFNKLIDSCSISFIIEDSVSKEEIEKINFNPQDRLPTILLPTHFIDSAFKFYYQIFWVPNVILKNLENQFSSDPYEQVAFIMLFNMISQVREEKSSKNPFVDGIIYNEEFHPIFCTNKFRSSTCKHLYDS